MIDLQKRNTIGKAMHVYLTATPDTQPLYEVSLGKSMESFQARNVPPKLPPFKVNQE